MRTAAIAAAALLAACAHPATTMDAPASLAAAEIAFAAHSVREDLRAAFLERLAAAGGTAASPLAQAEAQFQRIAASRGTRAAYAALGARDLRIYRHGQAPRASLDAALASPAANEDGLAWAPERVETATSGDFGYARGRYARAADPNATLGYFMRAWRREAGGWRIVIDVANPAPGKV